MRVITNRYSVLIVKDYLTNILICCFVIVEYVLRFVLIWFWLFLPFWTFVELVYLRSLD